MQASQSTNAEGKRAFPSPFTAPIQAARRLMERQQHQADASEDLAESASLNSGAHPEGLTGAWLGQLRYDEASIVARLDAGLEAAESAAFEEGPGPVQDFGVTDLAHDKQHQTHFKSPFLSLGLDSHGNRGPDLRWDRGPDPAAVRAAITRLARESQSKQAVAGEEAGASEQAVAFAGGVAFEDVALRVWGEANAEDSAAQVKQDGAIHGTPRVSTNASDGLDASREATSILTPLEAITRDELPLVTSPGSTGTLTSTIVSTKSGEVAAKEAVAPGLLDDTAHAGIAQSTEEGECLAHDAGNLLSAMRLYSELLCISGVLQERHRHYADDLKLMATRSQQLIDRLLKLGERLSKARAGDFAVGRAGMESTVRQITANPQEGTNVAAALERMGNLLQTISHGTLRIDLGPGASLPVAIALEPLERVLVNLVCNATEAVKAGGAIRVRAGVQDRSGEGNPETMVLTVDDSGCGMTPEQIHAILGERDAGSAAEGGVSAISHEGSSPVMEGGAAPSDQNQDKLTGTRRRGLGLRIVRELVAASGGRLFIQSQPGMGTRIEIHWQPLAQPASVLHSAAYSSLAPLPDAVVFNPGAARKPVGISSNAVSRIRAGSVAKDGGVIAC